MSELDDIGDIADQLRFGVNNGGLSPRHSGKRPYPVRCGSPDHMKGENVRVYRKTPNGKLRTMCKLCDKARRRGRPTYSAQGYPL